MSKAIIEIDGSRLNATIGVRAMNFGQGSGFLVPPQDYAVRCGWTDFATLVEPVFDNIVTELRNDYELVGASEPEDEAFTLLRRLGWPLFHALGPTARDVILTVVKLYADVEMLELLVGSPAEPPDYLLNTVVGIEMAGDDVVFRGEAFDMIEHRQRLGTG
jgi:hypothetical protein